MTDSETLILRCRQDPRWAAGEIERLTTALERLSSPEAFVDMRQSTAEERARMSYAERALNHD